LPLGDAGSVSCGGEFGYFFVGQEYVMPTVVGAGDEFWAAWVCGGVGPVGKTIQVFGTDALWGMSK
jgi:hypothetical protein